jgi:long-subunit fatty acid transport protein
VHLSPKVRRATALAMVVLLASVASARRAALELYEIGDIGTASAGQAALAEDASTAAKNPAGMTLLDRSQLMTAPGALLPSANFDVAPQTTTKACEPFLCNQIP